MAKDYKIFISHSWSYPDDLRRLRNLLEERGYFNVEFQEAGSDVPINSENASYIKTVLKNKIAKSNIVLGIGGMYASYSDWIEWELRTAVGLEVPIIGVIPYGQERVSATVQQYADNMVRWNTESIVEAIRMYAL